MIDDNKITAILAQLKADEMSLRLKAFREAHELFKGYFQPDLDTPELARRVTVIEMYYNLVRAELRSPTIRITDRTVEKADKKPKGEKNIKGTKKSKTTKHLNFAEELKKLGLNPEEFLPKPPDDGGKF